MTAPTSTKTITCCDCGETVEVGARNTRGKRCRPCQGRWDNVHWRRRWWIFDAPLEHFAENEIGASSSIEHTGPQPCGRAISV